MEKEEVATGLDSDRVGFDTRGHGSVTSSSMTQSVSIPTASQKLSTASGVT